MYPVVRGWVCLSEDIDTINRQIIRANILTIYPFDAKVGGIYCVENNGIFMFVIRHSRIRAARYC